MTDTIGPETQLLTPLPKNAPMRQPARPALSESEKAEIEAAKEKARNEQISSGYKPSLTQCWPDEQARYDYLWKALNDEGAELIPEDRAFMEAFEATPQFQRNIKPKYDDLLALKQFRLNRNSQCAASA